VLEILEIGNLEILELEILPLGRRPRHRWSPLPQTRTPGTRGSTKDLPPEEVEGVLAIVALGLAHATPEPVAAGFTPSLLSVTPPW